jgi:hypothetical protein
MFVKLVILFVGIGIGYAICMLCTAATIADMRDLITAMKQRCAKCFLNQDDRDIFEGMGV